MRKRIADASARIHQRFHLRVLLLGGVLLYVTIVAQTTSQLTPFIAYYPPLFGVFSRLGTIVLVIASMLYFKAYARSGYPPYVYLAAFCLVAGVGTVLNIWGEAFQLGIAGLTVGGSLLVLGCTDPYLRGKRLL